MDEMTNERLVQKTLGTLYRLQVRENYKWVAVADGWLFQSQFQAFKWLCERPPSDRPDVSNGWRVRRATMAELSKPYMVPRFGMSGDLTAVINIATAAEGYENAM